MNKIDSNTVTSNGDDLFKSAISQAFVSHAWSLLWTSIREVNRTTSVDGWPCVATTNSLFVRTKSLCPLMIAGAFLILLYAFSYLLESWDSNFFAVSCNLFILRPRRTVCKAEANVTKRDKEHVQTRIPWQREFDNMSTDRDGQRWTTRGTSAPDMQCVRLPAPHACLAQPHVKSEVQNKSRICT